jgi:hypothetical protein
MMQAADLAASGPAYASALLLSRASTSQVSAAAASQGGTPRLGGGGGHAAGQGQGHLATPSASLDKLQREDLLMHELDQACSSASPLCACSGQRTSVHARGVSSILVGGWLWVFPSPKAAAGIGRACSRQQ